MTTEARVKLLLIRSHGVLLQGIERSFADMRALMKDAFRARREGDFARSRILLNRAIDIECDVTGDAKTLGDLAEEWGVDNERDRDEEPGDAPTTTSDGECLRCGAMHAKGPCP